MIVNSEEKVEPLTVITTNVGAEPPEATSTPTHRRNAATAAGGLTRAVEWRVDHVRRDGGHLGRSPATAQPVSPPQEQALTELRRRGFTWRG
jgi:hypothetical protein